MAASPPSFRTTRCERYRLDSIGGSLSSRYARPRSL
eukprot:CAMPEP_0178606720 /NCGR_PEP_ID=MMETSP0697-20121206/37229_1 /TAXON_ID=265572 /ORGANISM="Extubocellulus spinifer, Strain CCMP396" /LENGTH=35 /DNA_ID= /DNA_START= /DNA_END= /DNA_ORIENTATION=